MAVLHPQDWATDPSQRSELPPIDILYPTQKLEQTLRKNMGHCLISVLLITSKIL